MYSSSPHDLLFLILSVMRGGGLYTTFWLLYVVYANAVLLLYLDGLHRKILVVPEKPQELVRLNAHNPEKMYTHKHTRYHIPIDRGRLGGRGWDEDREGGRARGGGGGVGGGDEVGCKCLCSVRKSRTDIQ